MIIHVTDPKKYVRIKHAGNYIGDLRTTLPLVETKMTFKVLRVRYPLRN